MWEVVDAGVGDAGGGTSEVRHHFFPFSLSGSSQLTSAYCSCHASQTLDDARCISRFLLPPVPTWISSPQGRVLSAVYTGSPEVLISGFSSGS